jgi:malonyl-CoA O-methyltransferase
MIERARSKIRTGNVRFSIADLTRQWPCQDAFYDLIVCNLVLEHIEDLSFIFSEASRVLQVRGKFLVNELHPFRQYEGKKARYNKDGEVAEIEAFIHHISDFLNAASENNLRLVTLNEWWHTNDQDKPPRLVSFLFEK